MYRFSLLVLSSSKIWVTFFSSPNRSVAHRTKVLIFSGMEFHRVMKLSYSWGAIMIISMYTIRMPDSRLRATDRAGAAFLTFLGSVEAKVCS